MKLLVINGPNLNMLGIREPEIYGTTNYIDLVELVNQSCREKDIEVTICQSNHEGEIVDYIQGSYKKMDAIIINPAAYTHTSIAILDALKAVALPTIEVHLSDIHTREAFRKHSYVSLAAMQTICGKGIDGYAEAINILHEHFEQKR